MISNRVKNLILALIFMFVISMGIVHILWGQITGDEGWYLHTSCLVMEGKIPYQDFFFTQAPLFPYIYGSILGLLGENYYYGRGLSLVFLIASVYIMWIIARRESDAVGEIVAMSLTGLNLFVIMQACSVMTPAIVMFLFMASILSLRSSFTPIMRAILSVLFISIASMIRLNILPAVILIIVYNYYSEGRKTKVLIASIITALAFLCIIILPFLLTAAPQFIFGTFKFHSFTRTSSMDLSAILRCKFDFFRNCISNFMPAVFIGAVISVDFIIECWKRPKGEVVQLIKVNSFWVLLSVMAILVSLTHLIVVVPYPKYEVMLLPIIALVISKYVSERLKSWIAVKEAAIIVVISVLILSCLSMVGEGFVIDTSGGYSPIGEIDEVCRLIRRNAPEKAKILTLDAGIAYQGGFRLLPGLDMSEFSFFPMWSKERCNAHKVVNREILWEAIEGGGPDIIALRDWDIRMIGGSKRRELLELINRRYKWVNTTYNYGQYYYTLQIFRKKKESNPDKKMLSKKR